MRPVGFLISILVLAFTVPAMGQASAERGTARIELGGEEVLVEYGRPSLRGRDMLSRASNGMVWRMGQNQATTLTTKADLMFGDQKVPAGKYLLVARKKGPQDWNLIINSNPEASANSRDQSQDVAEVSLTAEPAGEPVETFTISLERKDAETGIFRMAWGSLLASAQFKAH